MWVPFVAIAVVLLLPIVYVVATYNTLVALRNHIRDAWSNIDTELKRIQLSIKALKPKPKAKQHKPRGKGRGGNQNKSYVKEQRQKPKKEDPIDALKKGWGLK